MQTPRFTILVLVLFFVFGAAEVCHVVEDIIITLHHGPKEDRTPSSVHTPVTVPIIMSESIIDIRRYVSHHQVMLEEQFQVICKPARSWTVRDCCDDLLEQLGAKLHEACQPRNYTELSTKFCDLPLPAETVFLEDDGHMQRRLQRDRLLRDVILTNRRTTYLNTYYNAVVEFVRVRFHNPRIVEIGTLYGGLADRMAGELRTANVYAVDPFVPAYDGNDATSDMYDAEATMQGVAADSFSLLWAQALVDEQKGRHGCRFHLLHMGSREAAKHFDDRSLDVVFVDGLHTYEGVATDINAWLPKLRQPGGTFIFNDYDTNVHPGVTEAVNDFTRGHNIQLIIGDFLTPPGRQNAAVVL